MSILQGSDTLRQAYPKINAKFDTLDAKDNDLQAQINQNKADIATEIDRLDTRIDNIVAQAGTDNTEIVDARLGADNVARPTLGTLVREIHSEVLNPQYSDKITIEGGIGSIPSNAAEGQISGVIKGRTYTNILGSDGDCEDASKWSKYQVTAALDNTTKVFGDNSIKITLNPGMSVGSLHKTYSALNLQDGKYYFASAYVKNGNLATGVRITAGGLTSSAYHTGTEWKRVGIKFQATASLPTSVSLEVSGTEGQYAYVDGIMIIQITADEYNLTVDELMQKYNFINGTKSTISAMRIRSVSSDETQQSEIYIPNIGELRSLPNGVKDEFNVTEGKYIQRIGVDETDPGNPTFSRSSVAYKSDGTQVAANLPRFEAGKFGQAVMVEEGTTNALSYAFTSDANLLQYFTDTHSGSSVTIDNAQTPPVSGQKVVKHYAAVNDSYIEAKDANGVGYGTASTAKLTVTGGSYVTFSIWAKGQNGGEQIQIFILDYASDTGGHRVRKSPAFTITNTWQRYVVTAQTASDAVRAWARVDNNLAGQTVYWCAPQFEEKPYATSFIDGTRSPETLTIPTAGVLNPQEGTIECWVYVPEFWKPGIPYWRKIWGIGRGTGAGMYVLRYDPTNGNIVFGIYDDSGTAQNISVAKPSVGWHYFVTKWSTSEMALLIDSVKVDSITNPNLPSNFADTVLSIGCRPDSPYDNINTLIDDLRISNKARTDAEIAAAYASGQPLAVDEWTSYKLSFDDNLNKERATPLIYQLATPQVIGLPPQSLIAYPNGTIYWEPIIKETAIYNGGIAITNSVPIKSIEKVYKLDGQTKVEISLTNVTVASDGLSFTIAGAQNGETYEYIYEYDTSLTTIPTIEATVNMNLKAVVKSTSEALDNLYKYTLDLNAFTVAMLLNYEMRLTLLEVQ